MGMHLFHKNTTTRTEWSKQDKCEWVGIHAMVYL
jgi:hypothetical protein